MLVQHMITLSHLAYSIRTTDYLQSNVLVQSLNVKEGFDIQLLHSKKSVGLTVEKTVGLFILQSHINFILVYNAPVKLINEKDIDYLKPSAFPDGKIGRAHSYIYPDWAN